MKKLTIGLNVRKVSGDAFGRKLNTVPSLIINSIEAWGDGRIRLNHKYVVSYDNIAIMTDEEAKAVEAIWNDSDKVSPILKPDLNTSCTREDTGEPKQKFIEGKFKRPLFQARMRNPSGGFEAYRCAHCDFIHIGKTVFLNKNDRDDELDDDELDDDDHITSHIARNLARS